MTDFQKQILAEIRELEKELKKRNRVIRKGNGKRINSWLFGSKNRTVNHLELLFIE